MNILINALGIQDSGGITVLEKALNDCILDENSRYIIVCNDNKNINLLKTKYDKYKFIVVPIKGFLHRLHYENIVFKSIINKYKIDLIYNFSGTSQIFIKTLQLIKIHNLLFYSKKLDEVYKNSGNFRLWLKQIYLKRIVFKYMASKSKYLEIQSSHVKEYMSDFIDIKEKTFFIKSDIYVDNILIEPKKYNFNKKVKFLYIVGPHFEYIHKNFQDFTNVMLELLKCNVDFEINVTLTKEQLEASLLWDNKLNDKTNFLGYIGKDKINKYFSDNTILISTSIVETLGLHVIEAIQNSIVPIVPDEHYAISVYGDNILRYKLFDIKSLLNLILSIINNKIDCSKYILQLQNDLKISEKNKYQNIIDIFEKVKDVQR